MEDLPPPHLSDRYHPPASFSMMPRMIASIIRVHSRMSVSQRGVEGAGLGHRVGDAGVVLDSATTGDAAVLTQLRSNSGRIALAWSKHEVVGAAHFVQSFYLAGTGPHRAA